jgi:hypothetical protein
MPAMPALSGLIANGQSDQGDQDDWTFARIGLGAHNACAQILAIW